MRDGDSEGAAPGVSLRAVLARVDCGGGMGFAGWRAKEATTRPMLANAIDGARRLVSMKDVLYGSTASSKQTERKTETERESHRRQCLI